MIFFNNLFYFFNGEKSIYFLFNFHFWLVFLVQYDTLSLKEKKRKQGFPASSIISANKTGDNPIKKQISI